MFNDHKYQFLNPYIKATWRRRFLIFQTMSYVGFNILSLKYQKFMSSGSKDIGIRKKNLWWLHNSFMYVLMLCLNVIGFFWNMFLIFEINFFYIKSILFYMSTWSLNHLNPFINYKFKMCFLLKKDSTAQKRISKK